MPVTGVTTMVFTGACLPAWNASRPWSSRVTNLAPSVALPVLFQAQTFLSAPWCWPAPTGTPTAADTWACVSSEQASSDGAAFADGVIAVPTRKTAATTAATLILEGMLGGSFPRYGYSILS